MQSRKTSAVDFALGAGLGILFFLVVYGVSTLNVAYDSWIYSGYIEMDILQSHGGWLYFRNAEWSWPLTVADNLAIPLGSSIAFTDSIPLVAVLCKVFAPLLPATFQYFGWYNLLCCGLQGGFAMLLLRHFGLRRAYSGVASVFFVSMPVLVERLFRHSALSSQWMVLAALLLYFRARRTGRLPVAGFAVLCALAPAIHTYFVPMVYAILLAATLEYVFKNKKILRPGLYFGLCLFATVAVAYVFGILTRGGDGAAGGFGGYSMNLNALFNPRSFVWFAEDITLRWSWLLPVQLQFYRQYDGFNYLGLGVLAGIILMAGYGVWRLVGVLRRGDRRPLQKAGSFLLGHIWLLAACLCLTLFAISNVVTWGEAELFTVPLPEFILRLCAIFRASGRMFWPCAYLVVLSLAVWCGRVLRGRWKYVGITALLVVQLADMAPTLAVKHDYFAGGPIAQETEFTSEGWRFLAQNYDTVYYLGDILVYELTTGFIRYNPDVRTNAILTNRGNYGEIWASYEELKEMLRGGQPLPEGALYLCSDQETFYELLAGLHPDARGYSTGSYYFFANPQPGCPLREYLPGDTPAA